MSLASGEPRSDIRLYREIVVNAAKTVAVRWVQFTRFDPGTREVWQVATSGLLPEHTAQVVALVGHLLPDGRPERVRFTADVNPLIRRIYLEAKPVAAPLERLADGVVDPRVIRLGERLVGMRFALSCPLVVDGAVAGALTFHTPARLEPARRRTCEAFVRQAVLTLENVRLAAALREQLAQARHSRRLIATAEERRRREIAELLHGRVQGRLLVAQQSLERSRTLLACDPAAARSLLESVVGEIAAVREDEVRRISHRLHPEATRSGLEPAVRSLLSTLDDGLEVHLQVAERVRQLDDPTCNAIPDAVRLAAYRVVEEGLNNVVRHARARRVEVSLASGEGQQLQVTVHDDGRGCPPAARCVLGLGMAVVAAHVEGLGGRWDLRPAPGGGTVLAALLPWASRSGGRTAPERDVAARPAQGDPTQRTASR